MVAAPLRLRRMVHRGARHAHQRGALDAPGGRGVRPTPAGDPAAVSRLPEQRGERIDRDTEVTFTFDGRDVSGFEGDTIGSALFAGGQRTFSRSFKYHRRRGLLCCAGQCPNCLVSVDGAPGVRACTEPVREGMRVEHMNAEPSLEFDVMRDHGPLRRPVHPARLLLQDLHPATSLLAAVREVPSSRGRAREAAQVAARARVAHRVPPPSRRRPRDRGWGRRPERGGGGGGARCRRGARRRGPRAGRAAARRGRRGLRARARRAGAHRRRRGPRERARARHLRRPRAGLGGRHAPPDPRAAHRVRHRRDRAAAALPRQRPPGRDAVRRRAPARRHVRGAARHARGGGDRRRPRPRRRARAARRGGGDLLRRRPSRPRERRARRPRCSARTCRSSQA